MSLKSLAAALCAGALCVSCGPNDPSSAQNQSRGQTLAGAADTTKSNARTQQQQQPQDVRLPEAPLVRQQAAPNGIAVTPNESAAANKPAGDLSDVPPAPKEAQWTLYCKTYADPAHVETSRTFKAALIKQTGMREWYIVHEANQSRLYYGYYRSIADSGDAAESKRAQEDRKRIDSLVDGNKERPFQACQFVQLAAPDPESPPQWNLVNAPAQAVWTLMVGAYKDSPDRKKYAVDAVREARAHGEEAYYYHGETVSNVFIGAWPENAVVEEHVQEKNGANKFRDPIFVLPPGVQAPKNMRTKNGAPVQVVGQRLVVEDPGLQAKIRQYPNMGVNGEFLVVKRGGKQTVEPSRVIAIPRPEDALFQNAPAEPGVARAASGHPANDGRGLDQQNPFDRPGVEDSAARQPGQPRQAKTGGSTTPGRLRSIGD